MPCISVGDFVREAKEDYASPTTSTFVHRIPQCRETIARVEEVGGLNSDVNLDDGQKT